MCIFKFYFRVRRLQNYGVLRYLEYKWIGKPEVLNTKGPTFYQVTLEHVYGILGFYGVIISTCLILLALENVNLIHKNCKT